MSEVKFQTNLSVIDIIILFLIALAACIFSPSVGIVAFICVATVIVVIFFFFYLTFKKMQAEKTKKT